MRRIHLLVGILVAGAIALPVSRLWLTGKTPPPPPSTSFDIQQSYWQERITRDPSDRDAYVALGQREERAGFYISARRHLIAARALGAPDAQICAPLGRALSHLAREEEARTELEKAAELAPDNVEPVLNLAGFHVDARRSEKARTVLTDWVGKHPNLTDTDALERLTLAFLSGGDEAGADALARRLITLAPNQPGALSLAARCAFATGDLPRARTYMETLLPNAPDPSAAYFLYGLILNRQKDYDGALQAWQQANRLNPTAADLYEKIGQEYARRGEFKLAAYALDQVATAAQSYPSAVRAARAYAGAGDKLNADYWNAIAFGLRGDFSQALVLARRAAQNPQPERRRRARVAVAEAYRGLKRNREYIRTIEELTAAETVDDLLLRAYAYFQLESEESLKKRIVCLRKAAAKAPDRRAAISLQIAEQLRRTGRRDDAEKEMEAALEVAPDDPDLVLRLGSFYLDRSDQGDRLARATRLSKRAVRLTPDDEEAWLQLGQCHAAANDLARAARCLEHVIDLEPGYGPGYLELARVYARMGDPEGNRAMMGYYTKYVVFEQKHQTYETRAHGPRAKTTDILAYGHLLLEAGDLNSATAEFERVFARQPKDQKVREILKRLYARLGRTDQLLALEEAS